MGLFSGVVDEWKHGFNGRLKRDSRQSGRDSAGLIGGTLRQVTAGFGAYGNYNRRHADGQIREAGSIGNWAGRNRAYSEHGGPQIDFDTGVRQGVSSGARQAGRAFGRDAVRGGTPGIFPGQDDPRNYAPYLDDDRNGLSHGGRERVNNALQFETKDDRFLILNYDAQGKPVPLNLTAEQYVKFEQALYAIDHDKKDGKGLESSESGASALKYMLDNGLSPHAVIIDNEHSREKRHTLESFVKWQMSDKNEEQALGLLQEARANYVAPVYNREEVVVHHQASSRQSAARYQSALQPNWQESASVDLRVEAGSLQAFDQIKPLINAKQVSATDGVLSATARLQRLDATLQQLDTVEEARAFHAALQQSPDFHANLNALMTQAANDGASANNLAAISANIARASTTAKGFDQEGANEAQRVIGDAVNQNQGYRGLYNQHSNRLTTDELRQVKITDETLQEKFQKALDQQASWDEMASQGGLAGMLMMIFRPLFMAMNPDSDPMRVLAQAGRDAVLIEAGTQDIANKITKIASNANVSVNEAIAAPAREQTTQAPQQEETQPQQAAPPAAEQPKAETQGQSQSQESTQGQQQAPAEKEEPHKIPELLDSTPQPKPIDNNPLAAALAKSRIEFKPFGEVKDMGGNAMPDGIPLAAQGQQRESGVDGPPR